MFSTFLQEQKEQFNAHLLLESNGQILEHICPRAVDVFREHPQADYTNSICQVDLLRSYSTQSIHIVVEELVQAYSKSLLSHPLFQKHLVFSFL